MQVKFLTNGQMVTGKTFTKVVGLRFNEASSTLKVGETVEVKPVEVKGFKNVLGVFNQNGQVGNIIARKTESEILFELKGGKVLTNHQLVGGLNGVTFKVKGVNKFNAVLTVSL